MSRLDSLDQLGARERQIMEALFQLGPASVADVRAAIPDPPTYSAVRGMLALLEQKGLVTHERDGLRYLYSPTLAQASVRRRALNRMIKTFFGGSRERAVSALLGVDEGTPIDLDRLRELVERARQG